MYVPFWVRFCRRGKASRAKRPETNLLCVSSYKQNLLQGGYMMILVIMFVVGAGEAGVCFPAPYQLFYQLHQLQIMQAGTQERLRRSHVAAQPICLHLFRVWGCVTWGRCCRFFFSRALLYTLEYIQNGGQG